MVPLLSDKILGLSFNTLTSDGKYFVQGCENLQLPIQMQLSEKPQTFSEFFIFFLLSTSKFKHFEKNMMVIANVLPKWQTVKIFVRKLSKEHRFRIVFGSQHVKASQMLEESPWERFYHVFSSFSGKLIRKMSPEVSGKMLAFSVNTLTSDGKYPVQGCENLQLPIQMQLSEKQKTFSEFFMLFVESISKFKHFEEKHDGHS